MKKIIKVFLLLSGVFFSIFSLCSFQKNSIITVKGIIRVYGNEPFTFIGIKTENNKEYTVLAAADVEKELRGTQGKKIEITGILTRPQKDKMELEMLKNGKIELTEWKFIE